MAVKNVLIVDDSKTSRTQLSKLLQEFNLTIDTAESAEEAIDYLQQRRPDAIFLDHTMPGMDGLQALRIIKNNPGTALIPVAMYTSLDDADYAERVRTCGAVDILYKPPTPTTVHGVFKKLDDAFQTTTQAPPPARAIPESPSSSGSALEDKMRVILQSQFNALLRTRLAPTLEEKFIHFKEQLVSERDRHITELVQHAYSRQRDKLIFEAQTQINEQLSNYEQKLKQLQQEIKQEIKRELADSLAATIEQTRQQLQQLRRELVVGTPSPSDMPNKSSQALLYLIACGALGCSIVAIYLAL